MNEDTEQQKQVVSFPGRWELQKGVTIVGSAALANPVALSVLIGNGANEPNMVPSKSTPALSTDLIPDVTS